MKRKRIKKTTEKAEFCYSTVVLRVNNSSLDEKKAELTKLNQREYSRKSCKERIQRDIPTNSTQEYVEFEFFGMVVCKPAKEWKEQLIAAGITFKIVEK